MSTKPEFLPTPDEYEIHVRKFLEKRGRRDKLRAGQLKIHGKRDIEGLDGEYELDGMAVITLFGGAEFVVVVECKRYGRPVERDTVMTLWAKLDSVSAHKGMMFSTSGFQAGAIRYAKKRGIALIKLTPTAAVYFAKSHDAPPWHGLPVCAGWLLVPTADGDVQHLIDEDNFDELASGFEPDPTLEDDEVVEDR